MSEQPKVRPALSPDEWERGAARDDFGREAWVEVGRHEITVCVDTTDGVAVYRRPHALAAICLEDQPFGFTHEDLVGIKSAIRFSQEAAEASCMNEPYGKCCEECQGAVDRFKEGLRGLADRIEALLPPED